MLSKRYESTKVNRRTCLNVHLKTYGQQAATNPKKLKRKGKRYEKRLLLICIHHFDSDVIKNVDHMRISGT